MCQPDPGVAVFVAGTLWDRAQKLRVFSSPISCMSLDSSVRFRLGYPRFDTLHHVSQCLAMPSHALVLISADHKSRLMTSL